MNRESVGIRGFVIARLTTPKTNLLAPGPKILTKLVLEQPNLVTQSGDLYYGAAGAALNANATVSAPTGVKGMILGTGATAAAKTGATAAAIGAGTYISGSNNAIDAGFPTSTLNGSSRRITWETTWAAGDATNGAIAEAAIVNPTTFSDTGHAEADTISRVVFGATIDKQAGDTLTVTWYHDLLGA